MHIQIHTLTGKKCDLNLEGTANISSINTEIESQMGVPADQQKLLSKGKKLESSMLISDVCSGDELNVYLVVELEGGVKGKKKKKQVKKTKKKHKHRKHKLAILTYYKVEGTNVIRLKQQCKHCLPGIIFN